MIEGMMLMTELKLRDDRKERQNRSPLSPKLRYNVLRRDGFTCQYCGRTADERQLEIDHIVPVSKGGTNDIGNLQTACKECNRGKLTDEIITENLNVQIIEKVVYRDIPVEKTTGKVLYNSSSIGPALGLFTTPLLKMWAIDKSNPELAEACKKLLDAASDKPSTKYNECFTMFAKHFRSQPITKTYQKFCFERVNKQKNELIEWSKQTTDPILKVICLEVLEIGQNKTI